MSTGNDPNPRVELTPPMIQARAPVPTGPAAQPGTGGRRPSGFAAQELTTSRAPSDVRDAILRSLYEDRRPLLRDRRAGALSPANASRLEEIEAYINQLETAEAREQPNNVWSRLEEIARRVAVIGADVERARR